MKRCSSIGARYAALEHMAQAALEAERMRETREATPASCGRVMVHEWQLSSLPQSPADSPRGPRRASPEWTADGLSPSIADQYDALSGPFSIPSGPRQAGEPAVSPQVPAAVAQPQDETPMLAPPPAAVKWDATTAPGSGSPWRSKKPEPIMTLSCLLEPLALLFEALGRGARAAQWICEETDPRGTPEALER